MFLQKVFFLFLVFLYPVLLIGKPIVISQDIKNKSIGKNIYYIEDKKGILKFDDISTNESLWTLSKKEAINFHFTESVYWFKFTVNNVTVHPKKMYLKLGYPMLDQIDFYHSKESGQYEIEKAGDYLPFDKRKIKDPDFVFILNLKPGISTYYFRIKTTSSINFPIHLMTPKYYLDEIIRVFPLLWIYYGLMIIMVIYNLFIYFFIREKSYLFYVLFIFDFILLQMTLNGLSFQYLWPNLIWWANNSLPFFMSNIFVLGGFFAIEYIQTKKKFPLYHKLIKYTLIIPNAAVAIFALFGNYAISIKLSTASIFVSLLLLIPYVTILTVKKSRQAGFFLFAFIWLVLGAGLFILKTFGILEPSFLTIWSIQIGSSLVVLLLSLGLADNINVMRKEIEEQRDEIQENEQKAKDRAIYLEKVVDSAGDISNELMGISNELKGIGHKFSDLSLEQASTSEEMSATFEELSAANENIFHAAEKQKKESEKTKELSDMLKQSQKDVVKSSSNVLKSVSVITGSTEESANTLKTMIEKMELINVGGQSIGEFMSMIDDITDQINLLSLNAAIEAARAGEHGRGFAVVADEIGKLAAATSDNSKEISSQIGKILGDIREGMEIVVLTKEKIDTIFSMAKSIDENIGTVADLMTKQGNAIVEVGLQVYSMDEMSKNVEISSKEQHSSMEQTIGTIERLSEMAQEISVSNKTILDFTEKIYSKAESLEDLIGNME